MNYKLILAVPLVLGMLLMLAIARDASKIDFAGGVIFAIVSLSLFALLLVFLICG